MQTSIEQSSERRKSASPRIPVDLLVELCAAEELRGDDRSSRGERALDSWSDVSDAYADSYDADALDLSATGLRLRSSVLPDVGQRLRCRFDLPDTDGRCEAEGRVVWSNDAGRHGEFGLRFDTLSPGVERALARWAMDRGPTTTPGQQPAPSTAPEREASPPAASHESEPRSFGLARVRFDGVASAIEAEVSVRDEMRLDVEQALPFFELGRLATVEADGGAERRRLEHVSLRIENGVPKLVLGFVAEARSSAGDIAAPMDEPDAMGADSTLQDEALEAILEAAARESAALDAPEERIVRSGTASESWSEDDDAPLDDPSHEEAIREAARDVVESKRARRRRELFGTAEDSLDDADPRAKAQRKKKLDEVRRVLLDGEELPEAPSSSPGSEEAAQPAALERISSHARKAAAVVGPSLARLTAAMRTGWAAFVASAGPRARAAYAAVASWLARIAGAAASQLRERAPRLATMLTRGKTPEKRRTTAPPPASAQVAATPRRQRQAGQSAAQASAEPTVSRPRVPLRWVALGVVGLGAVGSLAYALGSGPEEPAPIVVPLAPTEDAVAPTEAAAPEIETGAVTTTPSVEAAPAVITPPAPTAVAPATHPEPSALAAPSTDEGRLPMPGYPTIGRSGAATGTTTTSTASSVAPTAPAPGPVTTGRSFGSERVEGGQTTTLRMSLAPTALEGQADAHGFTVTIRGALSQDRAATIARANPAIDRASILNRGDHSVLDIRFVEGRSPPYRVEIRGQSVDVTIGR